MAENDGIRRGEGASTGDEKANRPVDAGRGGSGVRTVDDGPGGQITGDPSAGGAGRGEQTGLDDVEGISTSGSGGIDDLNIVSADDPSLGLTGFDDKEPQDWAADTGPDRNPDRGITTDSLADDRSTLAPDK